MKKRIAIVGGGIVGLSCAYYLKKSGHEVLVFERNEKDQGASYVNAGFVAPSHFRPLAQPGMISKGLKWMFNPSSPFYMKPRLNADFIDWSWSFFKKSTKKHVALSERPIFEINDLSDRMYQGIIRDEGFKTQYMESGLMMYFQTEAGKKHEAEVAQQGNKLFDIGAKLLDKSAIQDSYETEVEMNILGGVWYPCDRQTTPGSFIKQLISNLEKKGVQFLKGVEVEDFKLKGNTVDELKTSTGNFKVDGMVLATGAWSRKLAKKLDLRLKIEAGKGYRIDVPEHTGIKMPAILVERNMAVSPMDGFTRFAGTMEIAGINDKIRQERVRAIADGAQHFYKGLEIPEARIAEASYGLRPVSFDGLPYIDRSDKQNNVWIASGHAMMGWSLGPATGKLIQELVDGQSSSMDIRPFGINR